MCGRYSLTTDEEDLVEAFDVARITFAHLPRYNIAPTQEVPAVVWDGSGRRMGLLRWGLVPSWAEDLSIGNRLINARSETADRRVSFRDAFEKRRCLVPADGFFEWRQEDDGKTPFWIHRPDRRPFAMAGLWERWRPPDGEPVHTCTILTRDAVGELKDLHPRMPVILDDEGARAWLQPDRPVAELRRTLKRPPGPFAFHPVSRVVNTATNDVPECIEPAEAA